MADLTTSSWDLQQWTAVTTLIQNLVLIATGLIGSWLAIRGYRAWHEQLKGTDKYTVGKRVLHALLNFRDAVEHVRNPFMFSGEMFPEGASTIPTSEETAKGMERAYNSRLKILFDARRELIQSLQDCAVLEGLEIRNLSQPFLNIFAKVKTAVEMHVEERSRGHYMGSQSESDKKWRKEQMEIIYSTLSKDDSIEKEISQIVSSLEAQIRKQFMR